MRFGCCIFLLFFVGTTMAGDREPAGQESPRYIPPPPPKPEKPMPDKVPGYWQLGPGLRSEIPELELSAIRYAAQPEQRFVILNGNRLAEGLPAGQDLWIHEIRRQSVIMKFRDDYFELKP